METVLNRKFKEKGVLKSFAANQLNIHPTRLSRIINNKQAFVSIEEMKRINDFLDAVILPNKNKFKKKVK